jgi:hypothetical protein
LEPKEKADLILKLLPYIIPKIAPPDTPIEKNQQESWESVRRMMDMRMIDMRMIDKTT